MSPTFTFRSTSITRTYDVAGAPIVKSEVIYGRSILPDSIGVFVVEDGASGVWIRGATVDTSGNPTGVRHSEDFYGDGIPEWARPLLDAVVADAKAAAEPRTYWSETLGRNVAIPDND